MISGYPRFKPVKPWNLQPLHVLGLLCAGIFWISSMGHAKNLDQRLGLGATFKAFRDSAALSGRYWFSPQLAGTAIFGFNTQDDGAMHLGAKLSRNLLMEENLNLYALVGMYVVGVRGTVAGQSSVGVEFDGGFGTEFFFAGLPNLGFQFELGLNLRSAPKMSFRTFGALFGTGGVHYYF